MIVFLLYAAAVCFSLTVGRPPSDALMHEIYDFDELFSELPTHENPDIIMLKLATLGVIPILKISKEENLSSDEANKYDRKLVKKGLDDIVNQLQDVRSKLELGKTNIIDGIEKAFENLEDLKLYLQEDGSFGNSNCSDAAAAPYSVDSIEPEATDELLQYFRPNPKNDEATENFSFAAQSPDSPKPEASELFQSPKPNSTNDEATENLASIQYSIDSSEPAAIDGILHLFTQTRKNDEDSEKLKSENTNAKKEIHLIKAMDGGAKKFFEDIENALFNKKKILKSPLGEAQNEI